MAKLLYKGKPLNTVSNDANMVTYDNEDSGMEATSVQGAIDEISDSVSSLNENLTKSTKFIDTSNIIVDRTSMEVKEFTYTATQDCWFIAEVCAYNRNYAYVYIDGFKVAQCVETSNSSFSGESLCVPLMKGQVAKVESNASPGLGWAYVVIGMK